VVDLATFVVAEGEKDRLCEIVMFVRFCELPVT
jgi:hypothetical protein